MVYSNIPLSYRFLGSPSLLTRNVINQIYDDRGLIIEASAPILVNYRNIASDVIGTTVSTIKGNASLLSFGNEGEGYEFRVSYYRSNFSGLSNGTLNSGGEPVYSIMAIEDNTTINLPNSQLVLNAGQSYLFYAPIGSLITADKKVVMLAGSYGDTPQACGGSGQDGTVDQLAPISSLGDKYLVIRGAGTSGVGNTHPEQTMIVATQDNTTITIENFDNNGIYIPNTISITLLNAGDTYNFHHGDTTNQYSSSLISSTKPISVLSGTAYGCETDFSTVVPINGCTGATDIRTRKFINYNNLDLNFFSYIIIQSELEPIYLNGVDLEILTGNSRIQLGETPFYLVTFNNLNIGALDTNGSIFLSSNLPLTVSIVQQEENISSMSAFFSSFGEVADAPILMNTNPDCTVTIKANEGYELYSWYLNGEFLENTVENTIIVDTSGKYSVRVLKSCGWTRTSISLDLIVDPCIDLEIKKEIKEINGLEATFLISVLNKNPVFTDPNVIVTDLLPSGYNFISYASSHGLFDDSTWIWNVGELKALESATIEITVGINASGEFRNIATVVGSYPDPFLDNNTSFAEIDKRYADLDAFKTDNQDYYLPEEELNYTIKIINNGPDSAYNVKVSDPMPFGVEDMSWYSSIGTNGVITLIDIIPKLDVNENVFYYVKLKIPKTQVGDFINIVEVSSEYSIDLIEECTGCIDIDRQKIFIPKGISPNGDGINDILDLSNFHIAHISIFNRYGNSVYSKTDYSDEWHGQSNSGKMLPSGTYFYIIRIIDGSLFKGYIQLIN